MAHRAPCHRPCLAVSQACPAVSPRTLSCASQHPCAVSRGAATPYRSLYRCHIVTQSRPQPRYYFFIATHPWQGCARALPHALAGSRPCRGPSWTCRSVLLHASPAVSHPLSLAQASLLSPVSRYNSLYRDPAQANGQ